jgi:hypothetical protein
MTRKSWMLIGVALALAITYAGYLTDWFKPGAIRIYHLTRPAGNAMLTRRKSPAPAVTFGLEGARILTEIKVVPLVAWQTNQNVLPLWHLVSDFNPEAVQTFVYGENLRGMKPAVPESQPQPLQPNVVYRLFVTAGKARGWHDFEIGGGSPGAKL